MSMTSQVDTSEERIDANALVEKFIDLCFVDQKMRNNTEHSMPERFYWSCEVATLTFRM